MARDFIINGETLVKVKGSSSSSISTLSELGLAEKEVTISPRFYHSEMRADDFGPNIPPEVMWMLADVQIAMTLVHFDRAVLEACISESMGGSTFGVFLAGAGTPMGGG
mgnify:FL=1